MGAPMNTTANQLHNLASIEPNQMYGGLCIDVDACKALVGIGLADVIEVNGVSIYSISIAGRLVHDGLCECRHR